MTCGITTENGQIFGSECYAGSFFCGHCCVSAHCPHAIQGSFASALSTANSNATPDSWPLIVFLFPGLPARTRFLRCATRRHAISIRKPTALSIAGPGQDPSAEGSSLDRQRSDLRDAERQRQIALQETPSHRHRRTPRQREDEEIRAASSTPCSQRAVPPLGLPTPPDTQVPPVSRAVLRQRLRREREAAAKAAAASAGRSRARTALQPAAPSTRFKMDVDNVTLLGYAPKGSTSSMPASSSTSQSQTPAAKRPAGSQAGTSSWLSKKKKGNDANAAPSSSPGPR
ncbi:hypothetical protein B0H17DRAFT_1193675 [Mycena rosella]|uniref:Uncharacterized protein n=1 Tax=Mycena rosella TaxID=1033263 RepID=A0AAD7GST2_MYCRO|nr:hypothetical protein B0H17DRAFT_1193675 [Mycena rosella]